VVYYKLYVILEDNFLSHAMWQTLVRPGSAQYDVSLFKKKNKKNCRLKKDVRLSFLEQIFAFSPSPAASLPFSLCKNCFRLKKNSLHHFVRLSLHLFFLSSPILLSQIASGSIFLNKNISLPKFAFFFFRV
jgi:hypothetical protein